VLIILVLCFQLSIAFVLGHLGLAYWWVTIALAYLIGGFANHALYVGIHEATHDLIFRRRFANKIITIVADLANVFPGALGFRCSHLQHHAHQGYHDLDLDLPNHLEARLVGNRWYGKAVWLLLFPFIAAVRGFRIASPYFDRWLLANFLLVLGFDAFVFGCFGANGLLYLALSFIFSLGLHPVGARWIQEHYTLNPRQETFSYYGPLNLVSLNVGYHNEHHDFPSIPWNRLPRLRAAAPEFYNDLGYYNSWTKLLFCFIFDPRYSLYCRIVRPHT
jgi:sphingolipid delta-4 desaturase